MSTNPTREATREAQPSATPQESVATCCTCGHQWQTGTNGSHSCATVLKASLQQANARERDLKDELAKRDAGYETLRQLNRTNYEAANRFMEERDTLKKRLNAAEAELARSKQLVSERTEQANGFEQALIAQQAENARLAALVDDQGITLAFVHGVLIVIETSPDDFNMGGLREAIKRVALALTNQDAAMRSGGEGDRT